MSYNLIHLLLMDKTKILVTNDLFEENIKFIFYYQLTEV